MTRCAAAGRFLASLAFLDGLIVLAGWILNLPVLASFIPGTLSKPRTAIGLMAAAAAGWVGSPATPEPGLDRTRPRNALAGALAILTLLIGVATLAELTFAPTFNIEPFLHAAFPTPLADRLSVRTSVAAAMGLAMLGGALLANTLKASRLGLWLALAASWIALAVLAGYLYEATAPSGTPLLAETALPTGLGLLFASLSILAARPADGVMRVFTSAELGGTIVRRALLPVALTPVLVNWFELSGERHGWFPANIGSTLNAIVTITALFALIWRGASVIQRKNDAERQLLASIVNDSDDAIISKTLDGVILSWNAGAEMLYGYTAAEAVGQPISLIIPPEQSTELPELLDGLRLGKHLKHYESLRCRKDGSRVPVSLTLSPIRDAAGRVIAASAIARDISDRKRQDEALRNSEERFRLIAETVTQVFWMADVNIDTLLYVSPAYENVWGRSLDSVYRDPKSFLEAVHPDDRARMLDELKVQAAGLPFDHDYRIIRPDGQIRWIRDRGFPFRQEVGAIRMYVGIAEDITERQQAAEHLRESLERFELIARATHDATYEFNIVTGQVWRSELYLQRFGYNLQATPSSEAWVADIHPADRERVLASFAAALEGQSEEWSGEYRYRRPDGSFATVHDLAFIVRDPAAGARVKVVGSVQDVSEQRGLEAQFRQAQKMEAFGQLAGGIAHDFNNIITAIAGFSDLLLARESPGSTKRPDLVAISEAARRAAALTRQLLLFSRRELMEVTAFDVNEAIHKVAQMLSRTIGEDIRVKLALSSRPLSVDGDPSMFDQIILNLAVNARDAMPRGGRLTIASTNEEVARLPPTRRANAAPGSYVCVSVSDTGSGIPPEILPRIFEPFFTTKPAGRGTGLGLATVFGIVQQHKGWIDVKSHVGSGTTVEVWLPGSRSAARPKHTRQVARFKGRGETILIVEDDAPVRTMMWTVLSRNGYNVFVANDAVEALAVWQASAQTIRLLLTDIVMPSGMNGRELASKLHGERQELKVLLTTGYSADAEPTRLDSDEQKGFLRKPFTPDELLAAVHSALSTTRSGS